MQKLMSVGLAALAAGSVMASPAFAMGAGRLKGAAVLATPVSDVTEVKVAGVTWRCRGATCTGSGPAYSGLDDVIKECRKLSAAVGRLDGFKSRGRALVGGRLERCNRLAGRDAPDGQQVAQAR